MKAALGVIYLVPVPIGNLGDITLRALEILKAADLIACEDTRKTSFLLNHYEIPIPKLVSFHKFNERQREASLFKHLESGHDLVIVSDAGSPGISDPSEKLVQMAIERGIQVIALPGASALIPAITTAGMNAQQFQFIGFLPSEPAKRKHKLKEISLYAFPSVIYESPHRLLSCLAELLEYCGNRKIAISREISKLHEEHIYGYLEDIINDEELTLKGEFAIVIQGNSEEETATAFNQIDISYHIGKCLKAGMGTRESSVEIASIFSLTKSEAYNTVIAYLKRKSR
ncbi:MAG: 16S rRNA (cytidine(1402)-2'-O)-methyltransferase [Candidatus Cloacimonetes bacterium]|nr:16S rRNA (cytidine(1402)-2'-O)-methyltransferase [Candidatus Cloacimonadota bacterium]